MQSESGKYPDGFYWVGSERSSNFGIVQRLGGSWWLINEVGPVSLEEINRRGWEIIGPVETPGYY